MTRPELIASLLALAAIPSTRTASLAGRRLVDPAELRHDLDELWHAMLAVGVYPFATSDRAAVTERYRATRASLVAPLDPYAFLLAIAPVFGALNDGHVGLRPAGAFMESLAVPVRCTVDRGRTIVLASYEDAIEPGSTLDDIANVPAEHIRDVTLAGWGGQTPRLQRERFASACRIVATILAGDPSSYTLRWTTPRGARKSATLPRAVVALPWARAASQRYRFQTVGNGSIGLIDYRQCTGLQAFAAFLRETFAFVRTNRLRGMIVDIRNNSGGDSDLNNALWGYLTTKTFTQFGPIVMRSSEFLKRLYGKATYVEIYGIETWDAPDGTLVTYSQEKIGSVVAQPNELRFAGPVALLIGPRTFSSALDCAIAAKDYGLATLIGEETSEPTHTTGELFEMSTRFTGTVGSFTTKYFTPPKRAAVGRGVVPDIEVKTTLEDVIAGRDPVLTRAISELRRNVR